MSLTAVLVFASIAMLQSGTPGPSVVLLISNSIRYGFVPSIIALTGDLVGVSVLAALSALGASAILLANAKLFLLIKLAGALYLFYIGLNILIKAYRHPESTLTQLNHYQPMISYKKIWLQSFLIAISNPKAILFFTALFPQFIDPQMALLPQLIALITIFVMSKFMLLAVYAWVCSRAKNIQVKPKIQTALTSIKGLSFITFGLLLLKSSWSKS